MITLTGLGTRTITGYAVTLLEYPRWLIDRDLDFSDCHLQGRYEAEDGICKACDFGTACRWLSKNRDAPSLETPLGELVDALRTATDYIRTTHADTLQHDRHCDCDTCSWLREASAFLRSHRHHA